MEGLGGDCEGAIRSVQSLRGTRVGHRWIAFVFLAVSAMMLIIYLAAAAFSV